MERGSKLVVGLLIGAVAGALAGILLSPNSGKANREQLAARTTQMRERAREAVGNLRQRVRRAREETSSDYTDRHIVS